MRLLMIRKYLLKTYSPLVTILYFTVWEIFVFTWASHIFNENSLSKEEVRLISNFLINVVKTDFDIFGLSDLLIKTGRGANHVFITLLKASYLYH